MANRIEAILEGRDVQPQNSYEAALKQHVASGGSGGGGAEKLVIPIDLSQTSGTLDISPEDFVANYDNCVFDCGSDYGMLVPTLLRYEEQDGVISAGASVVITDPGPDNLEIDVVGVLNYGETVIFVVQKREYAMTPYEEGT